MNRDYRLLNRDGRWAGARLDGLVVDADGSLTLPPPDPTGGTTPPRTGSFITTPAAFAQVTAWGTVRADVAANGGGHLQLFTCSTGGDEQPPPLPPFAAPASSDAEDTLAGRWRAAPLGATTLLALCAENRQLWVGGWLHADTTDAPALRQVRVEAADDTWLELLPAVYRRDLDSRRFLSQLLALLRSGVAPVAARLDELPRTLDPMATPDSGSARTALEQLAGWVGIELDEADPADPRGPDRRRALVAGAMAAGAMRGTREGIQKTVLDETGVTVSVEEPGSWCSVWSLGSDSQLGVSTMLRAADPDGAVLGTTATLGQARLTPEQAYGAPALVDLAGRVTVATFAATLGNQSDRVTQVVDRERPAFTRAHLCIIAARMLVGAQSRLGIDTIVAAPPEPPAADHRSEEGR